MSDEDLFPGPTPTDDQAVDSSRLLPVRVTRSNACPRHEDHSVSVRSDGAIWCRGCDEAFYPADVIWASLVGVVSV